MKHFAYPLTLDNSSLKLVEDRAELARQAILSALFTFQTERVMRPKYGINTRPFDELDLGAITADARRAIEAGLAYTRDVQFDILASVDQGGVVLDIAYALGDEKANLTVRAS